MRGANWGIYASAFTSGGAVSVIQSIQHFEIAIGSGAASNTATISAITTANSIIIFGGCTSTNTSGATARNHGRLGITNSTTITASRGSTTDACTVRGCVIEFKASAFVSIQAFSVTIANGSSSNTGSISSVNTANSALFFAGFSSGNTGTSPPDFWCAGRISSATVVTADRGTTGNGNAVTYGGYVVEFNSSVITSIQQRAVTLTSATTTDTDAISSVNTANTTLVYDGTLGTALADYRYMLQLTTSTLVTLTRSGTGTTSRTIRYTVIEWATGVVKSNQQNLTAIVAATSADSTITSVTTSAALLSYLGYFSTTNSINESFASSKLLNGTTVRGQKNTAGLTTSTVGWNVTELN